MINHDTVYQNCPHFAVADDPTTGLLFPSQMGRCFRVEPATAVPLDHQQTFCLSSQHPTCPIYCQSQPLPTALPLPQPAAKRGRRLITAVFLLSLLVFSLWQWARRPTATPLPTVAAVAAVANTPPPSATAKPTLAPSVAPTQTATVIASPTPTSPPLSTATPNPSPTPTTVSPTPTLPSVVVNVERLNIRSGPSTEYPVLLVAQTGAQFTAVGSLVARDWWQVCCVNGQLAWVVAEAVTFVGDETAVPPASSIPPLPTAEP